MTKTKTGHVTAATNHQTITVQVDRMVSHPKYGKRYRTSKKFAVHDAKNDAKVGDTVTIAETTPISKTKHWRLVTVIKHAEIAHEMIDEQPGATL